MSNTAYSSLVPRVAINVRQCPNVVIERALADSAIEFCETTLAWRVFPTDITTSSGDYEYALAGLPADTELAHPIYAHIASQPLEVLTVEQVAYQYPNWPDVSSTGISQPRALTAMSVNTILTVPVPDAAYTISLQVAVKPTRTATFLDSGIVDEWMDGIVFGAVHKLLSQVKVPWADEKAAIYYGKMWRHYTLLARAKVNKSLTRANLSVAMVPFA